MRTTLLTLLLAIGIAAIPCEELRAQTNRVEPKNPEAEKLAKAIVTAISTDNYLAFTDLMVTQRDYVTIMRSSTDPEDKARADDSVAGMHKVNRTARRSFDGIRKEGTQDGIAWEKAQYKSSRFTIDTVNGVEIIRMVIIIGFRGAEYPITAGEVVRTKSGWKVLGRIRYGDRLTAEEEAKRLMDSIRVMDSMLQVQMEMMYDSMKMVDSLAAVIEMQRLADSASEAERKKIEDEKRGKNKRKKK